MNENHFCYIKSKAGGLGSVGAVENGILTLTSQWSELIMLAPKINGIVVLHFTGW